MSKEDDIERICGICAFSTVWRGIGEIKNSGMALKAEYSRYDAGSRELTNDTVKNKNCRCGEVIAGFTSPCDCPLFAKPCKCAFAAAD